MAEVNQQQVIDYIKGISVLELSQLVKALESELGVSAAAAMPMAMPGMAGGGGAGTEHQAGTGHRPREPPRKAGAVREVAVRDAGADAAVRVGAGSGAA